jgi:putative endonuclease
MADGRRLWRAGLPTPTHGTQCRCRVPSMLDTALDFSRSECRHNGLGQNMYYLYILKCKDCSYYVGASKNLTERLKKHNKAQVKYTKSRLPVKLIYKEKYPTFKKASKREKQIKSWKKRRAIENLIKRKSGPIV